MNEEEIQRRLIALRQGGASAQTIQAFLAQARSGGPSPGARFANPAAPAMTDQSEPVLPGAPRQQSVDEKNAAQTSVMLQGLNPFQDELTGAVQGLIGERKPGETFPQAYARFRDQERTRVAAEEKANPKTSAALEFTGSLPWMAAGGAGAVGNLTRMQRLTQNAKAAGVAGAAYGFGRAEGSPGRQLAETAASGVAGAALPALAAGAGAVADVTGVTPKLLDFARWISKRVPGMSGPDALAWGQRALVKAQQREGASVPSPTGMTPGQPLATAGAELGPEAQAVVRASARKSPVVNQQADALLAQTDAARRAAGDKIQQIVGTGQQSPQLDDQTLRDLLSVKNKRLQDAVAITRKEMEDELPVKLDPFSGTVADAQKLGDRLVDAQGKPVTLANLPPTLQIPAGSFFEKKEIPTLEFVDNIGAVLSSGLKKDIDNPAKAPFARQALGRFQDIKDHVQTLVPDLKDALDEYGRTMRTFRATQELTGSRPKVSIATGKKEPRVPFQTTLEGELPYTVARGAADPFRQSGQRNFLIAFLRDQANMARGRALKEAGQVGLQTGPSGAGQLNRMRQIANAMRASPRGSRALGVGAGITAADLLNPDEQQ